MSKTEHKMSSVTLRRVIRISSIDGQALEHTQRGSVHKVKGEANLYVVRMGKQVSREYHGDAKIGYVYSDADTCAEHGEPLWQIPSGMTYCKECEREVDRAYREAKRNGDPLNRERREQEKKERTERVMEQQRIRDLSRDAMITNLLRGQMRSADYGKGSKEKRWDYAVCLMTRTCEQQRITTARAAELLGVEEFAPMTWAEFAAKYPKNQAQDEVA